MVVGVVFFYSAFSMLHPAAPNSSSMDGDAASASGGGAVIDYARANQRQDPNKPLIGYATMGIAHAVGLAVAQMVLFWQLTGTLWDAAMVLELAGWVALAVIFGVVSQRYARIKLVTRVGDAMILLLIGMTLVALYTQVHATRLSAADVLSLKDLFTFFIPTFELVLYVWTSRTLALAVTLET